MGRPRQMRKFLVLVSLVWLCGAQPLQAEEAEDVPPLQQAFVLWQQGYLFHLFGAYDEAARLFRKSIEIHPTAEAHTFLGC